MNVGALAFVAQMFRIESFPWQIFHLMSMKCPSLSFLKTFGCKQILFNIGIATPASFLRPFALKIVFQPFTLRQFLFLSVRYTPYMQQNAVSCSHNQSVNLYLFIGELSLLTLRNVMLGNSDCYFLLFLLLEMKLCSFLLGIFFGVP